MNDFDDFFNQPAFCKYCGKTVLYGDMIWLNGKCMCPKCYMEERAKEDAKNESK